MNDFYTTEEIAAKFDVCTATVRAWTKEGRLPVERVNAKLFRFPKAQVDALTLTRKRRKRSARSEG